jgi:hypothetical protein
VESSSISIVMWAGREATIATVGMIPKPTMHKLLIIDLC